MKQRKEIHQMTKQRPITPPAAGPAKPQPEVPPAAPSAAEQSPKPQAPAPRPYGTSLLSMFNRVIGEATPRDETFLRELLSAVLSGGFESVARATFSVSLKDFGMVWL